MISGKITPTGSKTGKITSGSGTADHSRLTNRDLENQHPISAITDLQAALDEKLDSETALPLIEEAVKYKAKGLYYDINKELSTKAYWYLTSEIDPITKQGTKASIISGPYDLGQGGGGGGGVTKITLAIATDPESGKPMWPYNISVGNKCEIGVEWTSKRDDEPTGRGTMYVYVSGKLVETRTVPQGLVKFTLTDYIISGDNKIEIKVVDAYNTTKNLVDNINGIILKLSSNFEDDISYTGNLIFPYTPIGNIRKYVYFFLDGIQYGQPEVVDTTAEQWTKTFLASDLSHGSHTLKVYFTCEIDGESVKSNELYYDIIYYQAGRTDPIIASPFATPSEQEQYVSFNIKYRVYTPGKNTSDISLYIDSVKIKDLTVDTLYQVWENRFDDIGNHALEIRTGAVSKLFNVHVNESTIHVDPVTQGLALALSSYGRSNSEPIAERKKWDYVTTSKTIEGKLSGFNWVSNGWVQDNSGVTVLRASGDARVSIEYKPFETDFTTTGKTFEFELATTDVKNYETRIIECLDGADTITSSQTYAGEDTRTKKFIVDSVDNEKFIAKVIQEKGTYVFIYNGTKWDINGSLITTDEMLSEYGITLKSLDVETGALSPIDPDHLMANDRAIIYYIVSGRGFYITPQFAKLQSQQSSLSTQYKEDDKVRLSFVVEKRTEGSSTFKTRLIYMYINGILSGVSKYPEGDSFKQTPAVYISIGSNDATVDIYNIRIYDNNLTRRQIVNNWIADMRDPVLKAKNYKHNDNYDDTGKISLDKIAALGNLPYLIAETPTLPAYKKDRKYATITYKNPGDTDREFTATEARMDVQGTSSQYYYKKNFKIKYEGGFEDNSGNWSEHYKLRGDKSKKEKEFTYKADVASSEGANNVELVRYFEDSKNWYSPAELQPDPDLGTPDSKLRIRVGIDGLPIVMFHNDGNTTSFYGKMNFNNDKGNKRTFGFEDGDESWEFLHNTSDLVLFKSDDLTNWQDSFESRYPEENASGDPYGTLPAEREKLQRVMTWVVSTRRLSTDTEAEKERKLNKFKAEFDNYFDRTSSLFYYLYTELFLLVDSRAKNAMMTYLKSRQLGDGGDKWFWFPYDMDTALGINNEGLLVYSYDKEDTDTQEGAYIFNGQDSTFWMNVRDAFKSELRAMYEQLRTAGTEGRAEWSFANIEKYFSDHQAVWSESVFNEDAYNKYLEPYILNQDATYLGMAQGSKAEQRRWWLNNRFKYIDSKYLTGSAKDTNIMLRAYAKSNFNITPFINCYTTAVFDQATAGLTVTKKAEKGVVTTIVPPEGWDPAGRDSVVILYSADELADIGDISGFKPGYADFSQATKLSRLKIGSSDPAYENTNLRGINVGANHLLTYLDARNCKNLGTGEGSEVTPTIDLSNCSSIEETYFENTQIKGCSFPVGGNLKKVHLPETLTALTIRNHPNLEDFVLAGTKFLTTIWLEDVPSTAINAYDYVMEMPDESRIRLININNTFDSEAKIKEFYDKLDKMHGLDAKGDDTEKAQVTGIIKVQFISYANYVSLSARYPEVKIQPDQIICSVKFMNEGVLFNAQSVVQGANATNPGIPQKPSTQEHYYTFRAWDKSYINVQTDLVINALFDEHIQSYKVTYDTRSSVIIVDKTEEFAEYGSHVTAPNIIQIPEHVTLIGWFKDDDTAWNFDTDYVLGNVNLFAKWQDDSKPTITLTRETFNKFSYVGTDNVGIIAWAVTRTSAEPETWNEIPSTVRLEGTYTINDFGDYYFWVKDAQDNKINAKAISRKLSYELSTGALCEVKENGETLTTFALNNTIATVIASTDSHYQNQHLYINNVETESGSHVLCNEDKVLKVTCEPKSYTISFNTMGKGKAIAPQSIIYLQHAEKPAGQYDKGFVIDSWYKEDTLTTEWKFDVDVVTEDITLFAKWIVYSMPSKITIDVETTQTEIELNYYQETAKKVEVIWNYNEPEEQWIKEITTTDSTPVSLLHDYGVAGTYVIAITASEGTVLLGDNYYHNAVMPVKYIKAVEFSWDMLTTRPYAFMGSEITSIPITEYMTSVNIGAFAVCAKATSISLPNTLIEIKDQAFAGCTSLTGTINLPKNLTSIGNNVFDSCYGIEHVIINNLLPRIGHSDFLRCTALKTATISESIINIYDDAFKGCTSLESITIPENVLELKTGVFFGCSSLSKVNLKNNLLKVGYNCFEGCAKLETAGHDTAEKEFNINFTWDIGIPDNAFSSYNNISSIKEIVLPETIKSIGKNAFRNVPITQIALPTNLKTIGDEAFCGTKLTYIDVPFKVIDLGKNAFKDCKQLTEAYLRLISSDTVIDAAEDAWFYGVNGNVTLYIDSEVATDPYSIFGAYWDNYSATGKLTWTTIPE